MRRPLVIATGLLATGIAAWTIVAGPLDPPSGPISSTFKTLAQVEPRTPIGPDTTPGTANALFRIIAPGSYYLTGNITGVAGKSGIIVAAEDVTIDLNGFALIGVPGSLSGIYTDSQGARIQVRNGAVRGWGATGVAADGTRAGIFENLRIAGNNYGINAGYASTVTNCTVCDNTSHGIFAAASVIRDCVVYQNGAAGVSLNSGGVIDRCEATNNNTYGIIALHRATITNCSAMSNTQIGIFGQSGCVVRDCVAGNNGADGIRAHTGSFISDCVAYENAAGIRVVGPGNRIEDNNVYGNAIGVDVDSADNFIVRNTARANNTGFSVVAGNEFAPVIANPGTTFTGATPWSNFAY